MKCPSCITPIDEKNVFCRSKFSWKINKNTETLAKISFVDVSLFSSITHSHIFFNDTKCVWPHFLCWRFILKSICVDDKKKWKWKRATTSIVSSYCSHCCTRCAISLSATSSHRIHYLLPSKYHAVEKVNRICECCCSEDEKYQKKKWGSSKMKKKTSHIK